MTPEAQAEILNRMPEVRWDRTAGDDGRGFRTVFGWVDKPGSIRSDFVVVTFDGDDVAMVTSSTLYSEDFTRRIFGDVGDHAPCVPVEVHYGPELVPAFVRRRCAICQTDHDPGTPHSTAGAHVLDASVLGQ